jgi:urea transport system permease protein
MNFKCLVGQIWMLIAILTLPTLSYAQENVIQQENLTPTFSEAITTLSQSSLSKRGKAIETLSQFTDNPQTIAILDALLKGKLLQVKADKQVVIAEKSDSGYEIFSVETGDSLGDIERSSVKKIRLTNHLRSKLRSLVATVKLNSDDASIRLDAVKELAKKPNTEYIF